MAQWQSSYGVSCATDFSADCNLNLDRVRHAIADCVGECLNQSLSSMMRSHTDELLKVMSKLDERIMSLLVVSPMRPSCSPVELFRRSDASTVDNRRPSGNSLSGATAHLGKFNKRLSVSDIDTLHMAAVMESSGLGGLSPRSDSDDSTDLERVGSTGNGETRSRRCTLTKVVNEALGMTGAVPGDMNPPRMRCNQKAATAPVEDPREPTSIGARAFTFSMDLRDDSQQKNSDNDATKSDNTSGGIFGIGAVGQQGRGYGGDKYALCGTASLEAGQTMKVQPLDGTEWQDGSRRSSLCAKEEDSPKGSGSVSASSTPTASLGLIDDCESTGERFRRMGNTVSRTIGRHPALSRTSTMQALRVSQELKLMNRLPTRESGEPCRTPIVDRMNSIKAMGFGDLLPNIVMYASGVVSWPSCRATLYFVWTVLLTVLSLCTIVWCTWHGVLSPGKGLSIAIAAVGALCGIVSLRANHFDIIVGPTLRPLEKYAITYNFLEEWVTRSQWFLAAIGFAWSCAACAHGVLPTVSSRLDCLDDSEVSFKHATVFSLLAFAYISGILLALMYCLLHVLANLEFMLDAFCRRAFMEADLAQRVSEWNVLQAILRRTAHTVDTCFVSIQTSALVALTISAVSVVQGGPRQSDACWGLLALEYFPIVVLALAGLFLFFRAAAVTEKCTRVPSLVNSVRLDTLIDVERQYVVHYIMNSAAGFYVKDVRLTAIMAFKITYFCMAIGFALVVHVFSK